jgi:RNA 2',3'-cyclic 3'-phosphodiesterase
VAPERGTGHGRRAAAPENPGTRRVFFALWPDDTVRSALAAIAGALHRECGGRVMRGPNIHLTLIFIGNVAADRLEALERLAAPVAAPPFELVIDTLQSWRHNRIAWVGASENSAALTTLVARIAEPLQAAGFRLDERPYVPHVTLVRDARRAPAGRAIEPVVWRASEFALVESAQRENRAAYEVLGRWPLTG